MKPPKQIFAALLLCILTGLAPAVFQGCKNHVPVTPTTIAYQTLGSVGAAVDAGKNIVIAAQVKGTISQAQGARFGVAYDKFIASFNLACALAGVAADSNSSLPAPSNVLALYGDIQSLLTEFKLIP